MISPAFYRERVYARYASEKMSGWSEYTKGDYQRWAEACRARLRGWLPKDKNAICLDLGCGPGNALYLLCLEGYQNVMGVDVSAEQVEVAKRICPNVEQADVQDYLRRFRAHFDLITAFDLIEHFGKSEVLDLLSATRAALKPGGALIIQTPNAESPWGLTMRYGDLTHELAFTPRSLEDALRIADFVRFEARECRPYVHGLKSSLRAILWLGIRAALASWNLIETGSRGSKVYTRVFMARAERPPA